MSQCERTWTLEVYQIDQAGGLTQDNAHVLCLPCHESTPAFNNPSLTRQHFPKAVERKALALAKNRCQCPACEDCSA